MPIGLISLRSGKIPDIGCTIKSLPDHLRVAAATEAVRINPANKPPLTLFVSATGRRPTKERIAFLTSSYWGPAGVDLTVGFLDNPTAACQAKILAHMNAWSKMANVRFRPSSTDPQVRIARQPGGGYWSYLGTDLLHVDPSEPTMNLEGFTENTSDDEYKRVVRHETGHTLGAPHEHMRAEIVDQIDQAKAIIYFRRTQGWSRQEVLRQVLTPIDDADILIGTPHAEQDSIMCYQLPGSITKTGKPILGGLDITDDDYAMMGVIYPKTLV